MDLLFPVKSLLGLTAPRRLRLRHIYNLAAQIEKRAVDFYGQMAETAKSKGLRALFSGLADDEKKVEQYLAEQLHVWRKIQTTGADYRRMDPEGLLRQSFALRVKDFESDLELVEYALEQEERLVEFYEVMEQELIGDGGQVVSTRTLDSAREARLMWKSGNLETLVEAGRMRIERLARFRLMQKNDPESILSMELKAQLEGA